MRDQRSSGVSRTTRLAVIEKALLHDRAFYCIVSLECIYCEQLQQEKHIEIPTRSEGGYRAEVRRERKKRDIHRGLMTVISSK